MLATMTKKEAVAKFETFNLETIQDYKPDNKFNDLRKDFKEIEELVNRELNSKEKSSAISTYDFDLLFGIKMYEMLSSKYRISERQASQDGVWMFLSIEVIPDVVFRRWKGLNESRYYKESRRIWLKTLWWYIHLSWQGDYEGTFKVLKDNTTDDLVQLVERSGSKGYRVELYREIMLNYSLIEENEKGRKNQLFRKVMKLNTARARVVEPALTNGGEEQYVKELFKYFDKDTAKKV
ncbi:hypothetical protein L1279_001127 [Planomicrobium sp. HSC-17F08]|nr:hypothetical protein [Planomicrobium sp. HSC-17F08]